MRDCQPATALTVFVTPHRYPFGSPDLPIITRSPDHVNSVNSTRTPALPALRPGRPAPPASLRSRLRRAPVLPLHALQRAAAGGRQGRRPAPPAPDGARRAAIVLPLSPLRAPVLARQPLAAHAPPARHPAGHRPPSRLIHRTCTWQGTCCSGHVCVTLCGHNKEPRWIQSMCSAYGISDRDPVIS